jgi:hypothetical protein
MRFLQQIRSRQGSYREETYDGICIEMYPAYDMESNKGGAVQSDSGPSRGHPGLESLAALQRTLTGVGVLFMLIYFN